MNVLSTIVKKIILFWFAAFRRLHRRNQSHNSTSQLNWTRSLSSVLNELSRLSTKVCERFGSKRCANRALARRYLYIGSEMLYLKAWGVTYNCYCSFSPDQTFLGWNERTKQLNFLSMRRQTETNIIINFGCIWQTLCRKKMIKLRRQRLYGVNEYVRWMHAVNECLVRSICLYIIMPNEQYIEQY